MAFLISSFRTCLPAVLAGLPACLLAQEPPEGAAGYPYPENIQVLPRITLSLSWWVIGLLVIGGLCVLGLLLWLLLRSKPVPPPPPPSALALTTVKLNSLRGRLHQISPSEAAHQVSLILREYQLGRYRIPAPYRTSEELYSDGDLQTRKELKERFSPLSAIHDRLAFAAQPATQKAVEELIDAALQALKEESDRPFATLVGI